MPVRSLLLAGVLGLAGVASAEDARLGEMAPSTTFLIAELPDFAGSWERFQATPLYGLFEDPALAEPMADFRRELEQARAEIAQEMELEPEQVKMPRSGGFAVYTVFNDELGLDVPGVLASFAWDDETMPKKLMESMLDEQALADDVRVDRIELRGREVHVFEAIAVEDDVDDDFDDDFGMMMPLPDFTMFEDAMRRMYYVRDGGTVMMSSDPVVLDGALGVLDGEALQRAVSGRTDFADLRDMLDAGDAYAMLLTEPMQPAVAPLLAGPAMMVMPIVNELFGEIRGYGFGLSANRPQGMIDQSIAILVEGENRGIMKLLAVGSDSTSPPPVVPADAIGYGRLAFDFANLFPTLREIVGTLPAMQADQLMPMLDLYGPGLEPALGAMGPDVHVFTTRGDVGGMSPTRTTVAIPVSNAEAVQGVLGMFLPGAGMQPRDFNGDLIYTDPMNEFNPFSVGLGGGFLVLGEPAGVESVLRSAAQSDLPSLRGNAMTARVRESLPSGSLVGWGFSDTAAQWELLREQMEEMVPLMMDQAGAVDIDAPDAVMDEMPDVEQMMKWMEAIDADTLRKYAGPSAWWMRTTPNGFVLRSMIMPPGE